MFECPEYEWLKRRFGEYDLVYLDPLICDPTLSQSWLSQRAFWHSEKKALASFLGRLTETLSIRPEEASPSSFMEEKGFGTRFKSDRIAQRHVAQVINQFLAKVEARRYRSVDLLRREKSSLFAKIADRPKGESLIIVDAMFATRASAPEELIRTIEAPVQLQNSSVRTIECVLSDSPGPLLTLRDPVIGLMVNRHAFYNWTAAFNTILYAGWYPFARTVGLYTTLPGGHPFVNVIAILVRTFPSLEEVLRPPPTELPMECFPEALDYHLKNSLAPEIQELGSKAGAAGIGTTPSTSLDTVYDKDEWFLSPICAFQLCCKLNIVTWQGLLARASRAYDVFNRYLQGVEALGKCLSALGMDSRIISQETDLKELLPEPEPRWAWKLVSGRS